MSSDDYDEHVHQKLYRSKGKCEIFATQSDVHVKLKKKSNANDTTSTGAMAEHTNNTKTVCMENDVWFQIAIRLDPEDVQTFALICKQTARLVRSGAFWWNMYKRHCLGKSANSWNVMLPAHLQVEQIRNCDTKMLRKHVIMSLFHCYRPLKTRIEQGYSLDWLLNRTFVSCLQKQFRSMWFTIFTFLKEQSNQSEKLNTDVVNDWETLAEDVDDDISTVQSYANRYEGAVLLIVICRQYMPLPLQLLYNQEQSRFRLQATREMVRTDMCAKNLDLDFTDDNSGSNQISVTVKYSGTVKFQVVPWWHSDFKRFRK